MKPWHHSVVDHNTHWECLTDKCCSTQVVSVTPVQPPRCDNRFSYQTGKIDHLPSPSQANHMTKTNNNIHGTPSHPLWPTPWDVLWLYITLLLHKQEQQELTRVEIVSTSKKFTLNQRLHEHTETKTKWVWQKITERAGVFDNFWNQLEAELSHPQTCSTHTQSVHNLLASLQLMYAQPVQCENEHCKNNPAVKFTGIAYLFATHWFINNLACKMKIQLHTNFKLICLFNQWTVSALL